VLLCSPPSSRFVFPASVCRCFSYSPLRAALFVNSASGSPDVPHAPSVAPRTSFQLGLHSWLPPSALFASLSRSACRTPPCCSHLLGVIRSRAGAIAEAKNLAVLVDRTSYAFTPVCMAVCNVPASLSFCCTHLYPADLRLQQASRSHAGAQRNHMFPQIYVSAYSYTLSAHH
jgi:hypothetical protein